MNTHSDQELLTLLGDGNHAAFTGIYHRYKSLLHKHAYQRLRNETEVNDIVLELFSSQWEKRSTLHPQANLSGNLYTATRNRILDVVARQNIQSIYIRSLQTFIDQAENGTDHLRGH